MPPAAIGAAFVAMGASAATGAAIAAVATAVYVGAAYGAIAGAATALLTGGDVLDGAVKGAVIGGVSGGVLKGVGMAAGSGGAAGAKEAGVGAIEAGEAGLEGAAAAEAAAGVSPATSTGPTIDAVSGTVAPQAVQEGSKGILASAGNWIENNPTQATLLGQTVGGVAQGMSAAKASEHDLEKQMEIARLNIDAGQVKGLEKLDLRVALPSIGTFTERPSWQFPDQGLIAERMQNDKAA